MKQLFICLILLTIVLFPLYGQSGSHKLSNGTVYNITIRNGAYKFSHATYSVFIPDGIKKIRGIFVHQHGCTMEGKGIASAYDLQYQAFARKWHLAIVGPDLYPQANHGCDDWRNPEDGSGPALLIGLDSIAWLSKHPELKTAPWLLWGHSGGGYWTLAMLNAYPDRIVAAVCYSPAFDPHFDYPPAVAKIPVMIRHAGASDFNDPGVSCWETALHTFSILRTMQGKVSIAYTPHQTHNLSYIRYMAIPFFESVLAQRLPPHGSTILTDMDETRAWLSDTVATGTAHAFKASTISDKNQSMSWLPDSVCAIKFLEYVTTGTVRDVTVPLAPENLSLVKVNNLEWELTWNAEADIESGIRFFNIYKNNQFLMRYPPTTDFQTFDTNGDNAIPVKPPDMTYRFSGIKIKKGDTIAITTINWFNLESSKATLIFSGSSK
jgi:pimeloyl-ACP methyl ester carboxylesterase